MVAKNIIIIEKINKDFRQKYSEEPRLTREISNNQIFWFKLRFVSIFINFFNYKLFRLWYLLLVILVWHSLHNTEPLSISHKALVSNACTTFFI